MPTSPIDTAVAAPSPSKPRLVIPPPSEWKVSRFLLRSRNVTREVIVLAPFPEYAAQGTGSSSDEEVVSKPLDPLNQAYTRITTPKSLKGTELEVFLTEMERCLRAGLSAAISLRLTTPLCKTPFFRGVVSGMRFLMERKGYKLGDAMAAFPTCFDEVVVSLVRAGETSGKLDVGFDRLAKRAASMRSLKSKFFTAMVTPAITLMFLIGALLVLHFQVLPTIQKNFDEIRMAGTQLPLPTRIVVGISNFIHDNVWVWLAPIGGVALIVLYWGQILKSQPIQKFSVRVPFVGRAYRLLIMARSLDALALLTAEGVPMDRCYALAAKVATQFEYEAYFKAVYGHISRGRKPFSAFLAERHRIGSDGDDVAARMEAASVTGEVAESLRVAASIMQERADVTLDALPKLIGPLVTILTTAVVGVIVAAVFLPTFQLLFDALKGGAFKGK